MPGISFAEIIRILEANGFQKVSVNAGSHKKYRATISGIPRNVTVAWSRKSDIPAKGTLASIIRQSGLDKKLFRK